MRRLDMKIRFIVLLVVLFCIQVLTLYAAPTMPSDLNSGTLIGEGDYNTVRGSGSFYSYNVDNTTLSLFAVKITVLEYDATYPYSITLGSIQLLEDGVLIGDSASNRMYAAATLPSWNIGNFDPANTFFQYDDSYYKNWDMRYDVIQSIVNGAHDDPGAAYYNFASDNRSPWTDTMYYLVGFDSPVRVTDVKLGSGTNRNHINDVEFYGFGVLSQDPEQVPVPEPLSIILLSLSTLVGLAKLKR